MARTAAKSLRSLTRQPAFEGANRLVKKYIVKKALPPKSRSGKAMKSTRWPKSARRGRSWQMLWNTFKWKKGRCFVIRCTSERTVSVIRTVP